MASFTPGRSAERNAAAWSKVRSTRCGPGSGSRTGVAPVATTSASNPNSAGPCEAHRHPGRSPPPQPQVHAERGQVSPQRGVIDLAGHELLGQRRAVVGRPGLGTDHGEGALVATGPQFLSGPQPGQARPGYHHPPDPHRPQG